MSERGYLTDRQYSSLRNVMESWHMEEWGEREGLL